MARRKDHSPDELKALVIAAVLDFLQQQPADQLSLRKVAKIVGYSPGTLINLFGSYAHLLLAANAVTLDQIAQQLRQAMEKSSDAQQQLTLFAMAYLTFAKEHTFQWRILFEHRLAEEDEVPQWQLNRINHLFALIESRLHELKPQSQAAARHEVSRVIWAAVHGICTLAIDDKLFVREAVSSESMILSLLENYLGAWKAS